MEKQKQFSKGATKEGWLLLSGASIILIVLFIQLYNTLQPALLKADENLVAHNAIKVDAGMDITVFKKIIADGNYFSNQQDIDLLADSLSAKLGKFGSPDNLGVINKNAFALQAPLGWTSNMGGEDFQGRLVASRQRIGFDSVLYNKELNAPTPYPSTVSFGKGSREIAGSVTWNGQPMNSVLVQLQEHIAVAEEDSVYERVLYARTGADGKFTFTGLYGDSGYSVLPLKPGFEFGGRKGTADLQKNISFSFTAKPHTIRLIGPIAYGQMKEDSVLMVRTPEDFRNVYWMIVAGLIGAFLLVKVILFVRKIYIDEFILPALLLLCGVSILILFSIQDPLEDTLHAWQALQGVVVGLAGFLVCSFVSIGKIYTRWWYDALFNYKKKQSYGLKGWTWLVLAIVLGLITLEFGSGPEGSGVKVNLSFGGLTFQPSEITKYLLLLFFAGFFAANEEHIRKLTDIRSRFLISWTVMAGVAIILVLFLMMGDMGPALVVCCTFLVFYSIARGNLLLMLAAATLYCILLNFIPGWMATAIAFVVVVAILIVQGQVRSAKWYGWMATIAEAPIMILIVIAAFAFGDRLPGIGDRLADRKAMWLQQWNNDVFGGDHLAHSYWTLASGGWIGQGPGKGFPNTMPAAHTDMILPSIGEELGWVGLVAIFLLFAVLIHRIFLHARRAGQPFSFYICAGIAIATGVQLLLIAGGSIGLLPLTGVTVPFLSYGKISLIINLCAMGIVAGISARPGLSVQKEHIQTYYDPVLLAGITGFLAGIVALSVKIFSIQIVNNLDYLVKPARVINRNGVPLYSYNPRIDKLTRLIAAGNIYDRKGRVVATSNQETIRANMDSLHAAGLDSLHLYALMHKKVKRFYPFESNMFFWTGDYNSRLFWGQANGYFAEARHLTALRGYATNPEKQNIVTTEYRPDRFTKPFEKTIQLVSYDYSPLAESLLAGIDSNNVAVRKIRDKDRDLYLSVDAGLQTEIQDSLKMSSFQQNRISVVVMDAGNGDMLASAMYPLANLSAPDKMLLPDRERNRLDFPVTDRDLGMTYATAPGSTAKILTAMAAFNKDGFAAAEKKYKDIYRPEIFRDNAKEQEPFIPKVSFVDMREAIINSSNIFFIRMANEDFLEEEMAALYMSTGMHINQQGGYDYTGSDDPNKKLKIMQAWKDAELNKDRRAFNNPEYAGKTRRYRSDFSGLAWGQGRLTATPVSMARMAGAIANKGVLQPSKYVLKEAGAFKGTEKGNTLAKDSSYANMLTQFMIEQSNVPGKQKVKGVRVAGKTGTPERIIKGEKGADGWYVFFAPTPDKKSRTVTCIRIEAGQSSANAVLLANTVAKILVKRGYLDSF